MRQNDRSPTFTTRLASELKSQALKMNLVADPALVIAQARDASVGAASQHLLRNVG